MFKFLDLEPEIFGMDISDSSLKITKLRKTKKGFSLVSFNEVEIKQGIIKDGAIQDKEILANIIKIACSMVKGKKLGTKYVAVSLPEEKSFMQLIQMPKMTEKYLRLALPLEAENYIPLSADKSYLDFQIIDSHKYNSGHLDLLVNVMPKSIVDPYVSCCKKAGLVPYILEVESQAIVRALLKDGKNIMPVILIDLGYDSTNFIVFSGNSIRFTCSIPISFKQLIHTTEKEKKEHYSIDKTTESVSHELVAQIKKYINFYHGHSFHDDFSGNDNIEKIILSGPGANLENISDFLSKELKILVELGNPFINITPQKKN
ncbi:MAG: type IV pilus assembly protein PilM, partial [Candidatus Staskawiczbacteria bacterium]|nr:type IV pilus assembly protein PilM [Candidatus Staskawiczbacteria bacterium]